MADALDNAREVMDLTFTAIRLAGGNIKTEQAASIVQAYAAIAQAEQLKRIADALTDDDGFSVIDVLGAIVESLVESH